MTMLASGARQPAPLSNSAALPGRLAQLFEPRLPIQTKESALTQRGRSSFRTNSLLVLEKKESATAPRASSTVVFVAEVPWPAAWITWFNGYG